MIRLPTPRKGVLFDLDGTLIDSSGDIVAAAMGMLAELELPLRTAGEIKGFIGDGAARLVQRCIGSDDPAATQAALGIFAPLYDAGCLQTTRLFKGLSEMLESLTVPLGVVSNKPANFTRKIIRGLGLEERFAVVLGGDSVPHKKPAPDLLIHAATAMDLAPEALLLVGDGLQDLGAAQAASVPFIGVPWGQTTAAQFEAEGAHCVPDVASLAATLRALTQAD